MMFASVIVLSITLVKAFAKDAPEQVLTPVVSLSFLLCQPIHVIGLPAQPINIQKAQS